MRDCFPISFYASDLPCPLPTDAEIENAPDISMEYGGRRIVAVGQHFVVKFGLGVNLLEGENMLFVRENTNIRVPRVYALYTSLESGNNFIVMERIIGQTLLSAWPELTHSEKKSISSALQRYFDELRRLLSPKYFGSIGKRHLLDEIFWTMDPDPLVNGPFDSEDDLNEAMTRKYIYNGGLRFRAEYFRHCFPLIFKGHEATFTHGDLQRKNIIICDKGHIGNEAPSSTGNEAPSSTGNEAPSSTGNEAPSSTGNGAPSITIIDWEKAGWYPTYWEYCMAVCALRWDDDWCLWIDSVLEPFVSEAAWFQSLRLELWS